MVKKTFNILILLFFTSVLIFYGHGQSIKEYDIITNKYFNSTIYLKTEIDQEDTIRMLKIIADENDMTISKLFQTMTALQIFSYIHTTIVIRINFCIPRFVSNKGHLSEIT